MDPTTRLREIREAIAENDFEGAAERFRDLDEWLSRGGFLPDQWNQLNRQ